MLKQENSFNNPSFTNISENGIHTAIQEGLKLITWKYKIQGDACTIITRNPEYAEQKSKLGYIVFCKRETNIYKFY